MEIHEAALTENIHDPGGYEFGVVVIYPKIDRETGALGKGYIGREFASSTYSVHMNAIKPRGDVSFPAEMLPRLDLSSVYIVRFKRGENPSEASEIGIINTLPMKDYARIRVDGSGRVEKLAVSAVFLDMYVGRFVDIETSDGGMISGRLISFDGERAVVTCDGAELATEADDILRVFYYGRVNNFQPERGMGYIDRHMWFHITSFKDEFGSQNIAEGTPVRFTVKSSRNGDNLSAADCIEITDRHADDIPERLDFTEFDPSKRIMEDETVYIEFFDGRRLSGRYNGESSTRYFIDNSRFKKGDISRLYRFGVITGCDMEKGTADINNIFEFSLSVAEPTTVNILKNQKNVVRLHVIYTCENGRITYVSHVSDKSQCYENIKWRKGRVIGFDPEAHTVSIKLDRRYKRFDTATHYLSVTTRGINTYVNDGSIADREVYAKTVVHPYHDKETSRVNLVITALDVRCCEESLEIRYDEVRDRYFGFRNNTERFPVDGMSEALRSMIGERVPVKFSLGDNDFTLDGYIGDGSRQGYESDVGDSDMPLRDEPLSRLILNSEQGINIPENASPEQIEEALKEYLKSKCSEIMPVAGSFDSEQAYYLATALRHGGDKYDLLYRLFSPCFHLKPDTVEGIIARGRSKEEDAFASLLRQPYYAENIDINELTARLIMLTRPIQNDICKLMQSSSRSSLAASVMSFAKNADDSVPGQNIFDAVKMISANHIRDREGFSEKLSELRGRQGIALKLKKILEDMKSRFLKFVCKEDGLRFDRLYKICADLSGYADKPEFSQQEQILRNAYREAKDLRREIMQSPSKEALELLCEGEKDILMTVLGGISEELNRLYGSASKPQINIRLNDGFVAPGSNNFRLIIENGEQGKCLQTADNLQIELESFTEGFSPEVSLNLSDRSLPCGEKLSVEVTFDLEDGLTGSFEFGWTAHFDCVTEFLPSGRVEKAECALKSDQPLQLQIGGGRAEKKNINAYNPYADPAKGHALVDREMFFGREKEKREILECIIRENDGEKRFLKGSAVIIHGQKKSGKTSLVNQIKNYIEDDPELSDRAIILDFADILSDIGGAEEIPKFRHSFYTRIMSELRIELRLRKDIREMLEENGVEIPDLNKGYPETWASAFAGFVKEFNAVDKGRHSIIIFMDEFTTLCTTVLAEIKNHPENEAVLRQIPGFIKTFSQAGFIQIIIGHDAMIRALETLGVINHTVEFAKTVEIAALDDDSARALVREPMEKAFGYDVYATPLGNEAITRLLDLSGRHPAFLMKLCDKMFKYYTDQCREEQTQLIKTDVDDMLTGMRTDITDFDILLTEDGDSVGELIDRDTYKFLSCTARNVLGYGRSMAADGGTVARELKDRGWSDQQIENTLNLLERRRVISILSGGQIKINTGLFTEFIRRRSLPGSFEERRI